MESMKRTDAIQDIADAPLGNFLRARIFAPAALPDALVSAVDDHLPLGRVLPEPRSAQGWPNPAAPGPFTPAQRAASLFFTGF
jgi:hypothetical protein